MATEQERQLYAAKVLHPVGEHSSHLARSERIGVTGFMAMRGALYKGRLMVVGRSVNGWTIKVDPSRLALQADAERFSHEVLNSVSGSGSCPMEWVTRNWGRTNGTQMSAFWRVIRGVVDRLSIADVEHPSWPSHLVWSNLYKVSPRGGNPRKVLCDTQRDACIELFKSELSLYSPFRLLLLTGRSWACPFLFDLDTTRETVDGFCYVEEFGTLGPPSGRPVQYVVAVHPQGRKETLWKQEVHCAFNRMGPLPDG